MRAKHDFSNIKPTISTLKDFYKALMEKAVHKDLTEKDIEKLQNEYLK